MLHEEGREQAASSFEEDPTNSKQANLGMMDGGLIPPLIKVNLIHNEMIRMATFLLQASTNQLHQLHQLLKPKAMEFPEVSTSETKEVFQATPSFDSMNIISTWELQLRSRATFTLPPALLDESLLKHYQHLQPKAHPNFYDCRKVDGVIGLPLKYDRPESTLPRAKNSDFG